MCNSVFHLNCLIKNVVYNSNVRREPSFLFVVDFSKNLFHQTEVVVDRDRSAEWRGSREWHRHQPDVDRHQNRSQHERVLHRWVSWWRQKVEQNKPNLFEFFSICPQYCRHTALQMRTLNYCRRGFQIPASLVTSPKKTQRVDTLEGHQVSSLQLYPCMDRQLVH